MPEYDTGYKKPPRENMFKPGSSGNPSGRPKNSKNLRTILDEELNEKITVTENGKRLVLTKQEVFIKSLVTSSLSNDAKARTSLINLIFKLSALPSTEPLEEKKLAENEVQILERFLARQINLKKEETNETTTE